MLVVGTKDMAFKPRQRTYAHSASRCGGLTGEPSDANSTFISRPNATSRQIEGAHELLGTRPVKKELVLVISTDKGLCGALNTNLLREVSKFDSEQTIFVACGRKGSQ